MKTKFNQYKILLFIPLAILYICNSFAESMGNLFNTWKQQNKYLLLSIPVRIDDINPIHTINAHTKLTLPLIFEPLVTIDSLQELQPILAKSWHALSNNKSIIIYIQPNHYFSDNTEVTAQDVVESITRVCSPGSQVAEELKGLNGCVERAANNKTRLGIQVIDKYELKFDINSHPTTFLFQLASPSIVITKKIPEGFIGSGPYLVNQNKHDYIILDKNKFSSKENTTANDGVILFYAQKDRVDAILKNNKPDGSIMYRSIDVWNINNKNYKKIQINPNTTEMLVFNNQQFPFDHPIVRKALASAIYNNFNSSCLPGAHKAYGVIPYGTSGSIDNSPPASLPTIQPEDVFKKVPELKKKKVTVIIHQLEDLKKYCESQQITKIASIYNINFQFTYHKTYPSLEKLYGNHKLDGFIELYVFRNREAYSILQFFSTEGENDANLKDTTLDSMLNEASTTLSSHARFQTYRKISEYIQNQGIIIPLFYMDHSNLLSKCVTGTSDNFIFNSFIQIPKLYKIKNCTI